MNNKDLIKIITGKLKALVKDNKFHNSFAATRYAGGIEAILIQEGFLSPDQPIEYETGGKKYFPLIGDFRWTESYPHYILKKAEEYLEQFVASEQDAALYHKAWREGWVLTSSPSEESYWWNGAKNEKKFIDWDKPLKDQMPFEITEA